MEREVFLKELGRQIAKWRRKKKISQRELAFRCDVDKPSITRIERGNTNPTSITLQKLSEALNVPISSFFSFQKKDIF